MAKRISVFERTFDPDATQPVRLPNSKTREVPAYKAPKTTGHETKEVPAFKAPAKAKTDVAGEVAALDKQYAKAAPKTLSAPAPRKPLSASKEADALLARTSNRPALETPKVKGATDVSGQVGSLQAQYGAKPATPKKINPTDKLMQQHGLPKVNPSAGEQHPPSLSNQHVAPKTKSNPNYAGGNDEKVLPFGGSGLDSPTYLRKKETAAKAAPATAPAAKASEPTPTKPEPTTPSSGSASMADHKPKEAPAEKSKKIGFDAGLGGVKMTKPGGKGAELNKGKEAPAEAPKEAPAEAPKETPAEAPKEAPKEAKPKGAAPKKGSFKKKAAAVSKAFSTPVTNAVVNTAKHLAGQAGKFIKSTTRVKKY